MKTYDVFCNKIYKGTYKGNSWMEAQLSAYIEHGDTLCPSTGTLGNWTAILITNGR